MKKHTFSKILTYFSDKRLTTVAGAWVYYFLASLLPLVFLFVTAFGVFGVDISLDVVSRLPTEFRLAGETLVRTAENASNGVTVFFVLTIIFSSSTLLNQMSKDGDFLYGAKSNRKRGIWRRAWAICALSFLFLIFLSSAFLFAFSYNFFFVDTRVKGRLFFAVFVIGLIILASYAIILVLNRFISPVKRNFSKIYLGALCSLFIIVLGTIGFTIYLHFFNNYNAFYGSLATIIVFMFWAYILMLGLAFGVIVNVRIYEKSKNDTIKVRNFLGGKIRCFRSKIYIKNIKKAKSR